MVCTNNPLGYVTQNNIMQLLTITQANVTDILFKEPVMAAFPHIRTTKDRWAKLVKICCKGKNKLQDHRNTVVSNLMQGLQTMSSDNKNKLKTVLNVNSIKVLYADRRNNIVRFNV